jgi:hypothetical protein
MWWGLKNFCPEPLPIERLMIRIKSSIFNFLKSSLVPVKVSQIGIKIVYL